ncbi:MAG: DUF1801 domain-containing protein [Candidatus Cryosericum sp.]
MNARECIDSMIASLTDWRGTKVADIRSIIHEADPDIEEECKWMGSPVWSHDGMVCLANAFKDKVKLTFSQGANLADPDKLFNNGLAGKQWRAIDLHKGDTINREALKALIREAVRYNQSRAYATTRPRAARGRPKEKPGSTTP